MTEGETLTYASGNPKISLPDLRILHYNDVYHIEPGSRDPVGGIARFKTLCDYYQTSARFHGQPRCLTLFSGDAFNPSLESSVTKGKHMVPALNAIKTDVACLGNHDLDFGVEQFQYLATLCDFPWLCANVLDPALGEDVPLGRCNRSVLLDGSNGVKVGVVGLVEREWLDTINSLPPNLVFLEPDEVARDQARELRERGAEMVIALTHQRQPNDEDLARKLDPGMVDMILSGHDHFYAHAVVNGTYILRSGTDFQQLSYLEARRKTESSVTTAGSKWDIDIVRRDVVASIPQDADCVKMVESQTASLKAKLEKPIGYTAAPLDARFTTVRLKESNLGNFVCDLMRFHYNADCCIMAAGTIRGDQVYPPGMLRVKDIMNCFPFEDPCVVIALSGKDILLALENAVGKYPALEGRFPQVSNITFAFDPAEPPGSRCQDVRIADSPVDLQKEYTLVTREYMVRGKDGFTSLKLEQHGGTARSIVSEESGMLISMLLRQYFMSLKILGRWKNWGHAMGKHWAGIHDDLHDVHPVREPVMPGKGHDENSVVRQAVPSGVEAVPGLVGKAQQTRRMKAKVTHEDAHLHHSDSEDDHSDLPAVPIEHTQRERELVVMRKLVRKWFRLARLPGHPSMCDEVGEEFGVHWTRGICPRVEGRIRTVRSN